MRVYVLIVTKPGTSESVVESIKGLKNVVQADSVYGRFDAIAVLEVPNLESVAEIVYNTIQKNPNVVRTETAIALG